ncbi:head-tail connector protein (plasmid) [Arsenophonus nasoniae]|uniref:Head-tail connector protein n=1 Tax=Arsenophonus nasoniae TaxID=638 RepID=D2U1L5_9GAMM|nr:head-tail connector protein [Arsenophonus nasoniae]QBY46971.1 Phage gp6-like head-tail connector protein [Arsenophonus nasoniae]WGM04033.1 head-tail connector protein [Arsenophonus nasoniae]WGM09160.1 head-tail connector protein [Arsenophonus nasoniae]WGM18548.1 head-tail connector protein [Arsenophonus nasoniae]CBA74678.1 hypothetical protein ARN_24490 [Arsenophonus nasoniae]
MQFVSLEEAKRHLRINHEYDNEDLLIKIKAASERIAEYIDAKADRESFLVKAATLQLVNLMYEDREGISDVWLAERLPNSVTSLLATMRAVTIC